MIPERFKKLIHHTVGRIFIVDSQGQLDYGSGMIVYFENKCYILTCKHNFKNPENCLFYFIPSQFLEPNLKSCSKGDKAQTFLYSIK